MKTDLFSLLTGSLGLPAGIFSGKVAVITGSGRGIGKQAPGV
jgi:hypothetical protein